MYNAVLETIIRGRSLSWQRILSCIEYST